ncbi:MAG: VOC family protein [Chamaesiphon sp.]|nr:VOC family protein [Chamaesiphon sp.]
MDTSSRSAIQAQKIQAICLTVTDLDRSLIFYTTALCFEVISDITIEENTDPSPEISHSRIRIATLKLGDEQIRLMQYLDRKGQPIPQDSQSYDLWFQHLAIVVSNMDRAYAHLQLFAIKPISTSPQTIPLENQEAAGTQAFKFRDPDRHPLELICFPPDKGQQKWHQASDKLFLGIDHTAIAITNTEQSLKFYRDSLGMHVDGGSFNSGETQARMDGLPDPKVQITALRPTQGSLGIELLDYHEPAHGRPIPVALERYDTAYVQIELIVTGDDQTGLIRDPTGHFILLIPESKN